MLTQSQSALDLQEMAAVLTSDGGEGRFSSDSVDRDGRRSGPAGSDGHGGCAGPDRRPDRARRPRIFHYGQSALRAAFGSRTATERCQLAGGLHHRRRHADDLVFPADRPTAAASASPGPSWLNSFQGGRKSEDIACFSSAGPRGRAPGGRSPAGRAIRGSRSPALSARVQPDECLDHAALVRRIRSTRPDILFAALGQPKGELWIDRHCAAMGVPACVQIGASLDFLAGKRPQGPAMDAAGRRSGCTGWPANPGGSRPVTSATRCFSAGRLPTISPGVSGRHYSANSPSSGLSART